MEGGFEVARRHRHRVVLPVREVDGCDARAELQGLKLPALAYPAPVGEVLSHGCCGAGPRPGRGDSGSDFDAFCAADGIADSTSEAVRGHHTETDTGDDGDLGELRPL